MFLKQAITLQRRIRFSSVKWSQRPDLSGSAETEAELFFFVFFASSLVSSLPGSNLFSSLPGAKLFSLIFTSKLFSCSLMVTSSGWTRSGESTVPRLRGLPKDDEPSDNESADELAENGPLDNEPAMTRPPDREPPDEDRPSDNELAENGPTVFPASSVFSKLPLPFPVTPELLPDVCFDVSDSSLAFKLTEPVSLELLFARGSFGFKSFSILSSSPFNTSLFGETLFA